MSELEMWIDDDYNNITFDIKTFLVDDKLHQMVYNKSQVLSHDVYSVKEKGFIDALIKLGWTPPEGFL